jgi:pyruvate kinase
MESIIQNTYDQLIQLKENILSQIEPNGENQSLQNLEAYLKLRSLDVTQLQNELTNLGLSSLGRAQSCVINSINQDIFILSKLLKKEYTKTDNDIHALNYNDAKNIMINNAKVFGQNKEDFKTKVMVTLPSEASDSPELISNLITSGASVLRINTAHDNPTAWKTMAKYIREENTKQNKQTKIYVDLAGPKNRTQKIEKVFTPFRIGSWRNPKLVEILSEEIPAAFTSSGYKDEKGNKIATLVVSKEFFKELKQAVAITIDDFEREKTQTYNLIKQNGKFFIEADKKITIFENTSVELVYANEEKESILSRLYNYELLPEEIRLFKDDKLIIAEKNILGQADFEYKGELYKGIISCSNKEVFPYIKNGDEIFIDDGKIGCEVIGSNDLGLICQVFLAKANGTVLKEEKGINFPSTDLQIDAITEVDKNNFETIVEFADIIGLSFAQTKEDIQILKELLTKKGKTSTAIAPKIETKTALRNLPEILKELIIWDNYALMIARGDLAIEVGFDNLPYIQEEILNICEAAHVPVIYATQILEGKMKNNLPSRAEVTDAAFAQRADCVMLNKGPYVTDTVIILKNILRQMHTLFAKNRQLLSVCKAWESK